MSPSMPGQAHAGQRVSYNGSHRSSQLTADGELTGGDDSDGDDQGKPSTNGTRNLERKQQTCKAADIDDNHLQEYGTPGPGAYRIPSCFRYLASTQSPSSYVLASNMSTSIKGRNWPAPDTTLTGNCSPGPMAYAPILDAGSLKKTAPRAVFSAASRERQGKLYLGSEELNKSASINTIGPGPAAYRLGCGRTPGRQAPGPPAAPRPSFAVSHSAPKHVIAAVALAKRKGSRTRAPMPDEYPSTAIRVGCNSRDSNGYYQRPSSAPESAAQQRGISRDLYDVTQSPADVTTANSKGLGLRAPREGSKLASADRHSRSFIQKSLDGEVCSSMGDVGAYLSTGGQKWSFGPPGGVEKGRHRRRSQEANVYISPQHAAIDSGTTGRSQTPGAAAYNVAGKTQLLSTHGASGKASFGSEERFCNSTVKLYLSPEHVKVDPSLSYSPGPGTAAADLPGTINAAGAITGHKKGPRFGSPPRSPTARQPVIGKQFEQQHAGQDSPGPACYDYVAAALAGTVLGDRRTAHFGTGCRGTAAASAVVVAPGPGAYKTDESKLSSNVSSPSCSLKTTGHKDGLTMPTARTTPGVGTYSITLADKQCLPNAGAATITGKSPHGGTSSAASSPGPAAYYPAGGMGDEASMDWKTRWGFKDSSSHLARRQQEQDYLDQCQADSASMHCRQQHTRQPQQQLADDQLSEEGDPRSVHQQHEQQQGHAVSSATSRAREALKLSLSSTVECVDQDHNSETNSSRESAQLQSSDRQAASTDMLRSGSHTAVAFSGRTSRSDRTALSFESETEAGKLAVEDVSSLGIIMPLSNNTLRTTSGGNSHSHRTKSQRQGFSILGKDTHKQQVDSPGPAAYEVCASLTVKNAGAATITGRPSERLYISKLHEESQVGIDSPGPTAYHTDNLAALSQHKSNGQFSFGAGTRPDMAKIRF